MTGIPVQRGHAGRETCGVNDIRNRDGRDGRHRRHGRHAFQDIAPAALRPTLQHQRVGFFPSKHRTRRVVSSERSRKVSQQPRVRHAKPLYTHMHACVYVRHGNQAGALVFARFSSCLVSYPANAFMQAATWRGVKCREASGSCRAVLQRCKRSGTWSNESRLRALRVTAMDCYVATSVKRMQDNAFVVGAGGGGGRESAREREEK